MTLCLHLLFIYLFILAFGTFVIVCFEGFGCLGQIVVILSSTQQTAEDSEEGKEHDYGETPFWSDYVARLVRHSPSRGVTSQIKWRHNMSMFVGP